MRRCRRIVPDIDAGPIVSQVVFSIYPDVGEVIDVYRRALSYGYVLFEQTMPILARISARDQENAAATYYTREDQQQLGERRDSTRETSLRAPAHV